MIQLAAILTDDQLNPMAEINRIVKPDGSWQIAPGAFGAHGISFDRCMAEGVPISTIIEELDAYSDQAEAVDGTFVAYNVRFDLKLIRGERRRLGRPDRFGLLREFDPMKASVNICRIPPTAKMVRANRTNFKTPNLGEAFKFYTGEEMKGAHDALEDCRATLRILWEMKNTHGVDVRGVPRESFANKGVQSPAEAAAEGAKSIERAKPISGDSF